MQLGFNHMVVSFCENAGNRERTTECSKSLKIYTEQEKLLHLQIHFSTWLKCQKIATPFSEPVIQFVAASFNNTTLPPIIYKLPSFTYNQYSKGIYAVTFLKALCDRYVISLHITEEFPSSGTEYSKAACYPQISQNCHETEIRKQISNSTISVLVHIAMYSILSVPPSTLLAISLYRFYNAHLPMADHTNRLFFYCAAREK